MAVTITSVLLAASLTVNILMLAKSHQQRKWEKDYPYLSPKLRDLPADHPAKIGVVTFDPLRAKIEDYLRAKVPSAFADDVDIRSPRVSVYVEDLNTGAWMGFRERYKFLPVSLIKVPLAIAAMRKVDKGEWSLDRKFSLMENDLDSRPYVTRWDSSKANTPITLRSAIEKLIGESDNSIYYFFRRILKDEDIEDVLYHLGIIYPEDHASTAISPKNYATMFRSLYYSTYLNLDSAEFLLDVMTRSIHVYVLRAALPLDIVVSHKIGIYYPAGQPYVFLHEVGIVYHPHAPYLVAIMTTQMGHSEAAEAIREITQIIQEFYDTQFPRPQKPPT